MVGNQYLPFRSSRLLMFFKVGVLKKLRNIYKKTTALKSLFNKAPFFQACNFIKKYFQQSCFTMNIAELLRTAFFIGHLEWLLLPFTTTVRNYYWEDLVVILFTLNHPSRRLNTCFKADNILIHKNTWKSLRRVTSC